MDEEEPIRVGFGLGPVLVTPRGPNNVHAPLCQPKCVTWTAPSYAERFVTPVTTDMTTPFSQARLQGLTG